jgi:hypothetical protein
VPPKRRYDAAEAHAAHLRMCHEEFRHENSGRARVIEHTHGVGKEAATRSATAFEGV